MTFLNPSVLLNMGATDAVKTAASNTQSQEPQANNAPDEFAQALRKQMQQANKPAPEANTNNLLAKDVRRAASAQAAGNTIKHDTAVKDQSSASASTEESRAHDARDDGRHDEEASSASGTSAANETPQERKKRLLASVETSDASPAGLAPWMQSMMAMRPTADQGLAKGKGAGGDATQDALQGDALQVKIDGAPGDALAEKQKPLSAHLPPADSVVDDSISQGVDAKQLSTDEPMTSLADNHANFSETLGLAKAVAAAVQQTAGADKTAGQLNRMDAESEVSSAGQSSVLPAAQALPNSPWLNAAGVAQSANVLTSQIATPFGNERWQTAMNQHVLNMVGSGDDVASLTLSPPDLGPIQVVLKVDNQSVNTSFISDNPLVRQALEDGMQDLRDRMQSQGLALGQTFIGNGQQAQQHFEQQPSNDGGRTLAHTAGTDTDVTAPAAAVRTTVVRGLVDTFV